MGSRKESWSYVEGGDPTAKKKQKKGNNTAEFKMQVDKMNADKRRFQEIDRSVTKGTYSQTKAKTNQRNSLLGGL